MKVNVDKTLVASITLHALVLGWGLVTFSSRSMEAPPPDMIEVQNISSDQFSKMTQGIKTGAKDKPKADEKAAQKPPEDDSVGKITKKEELIKTSGTPPPATQPVEKPADSKKADQPKPLTEAKAETKSKEAPKPDKKQDQAKIDEAAPDKQPSPKPDPQPAKPPQPKPAKAPTPAPKQAQAPPPKPQKSWQETSSSIKSLLEDKRDPTRHAMAGDMPSEESRQGTARGTAVTLSQSEIDALKARVISLWSVPPNIDHPEEMFVTIRFQLGPDRRLTAPPQVVSRGSSPRYQAAANAAIRAVLQGQPYNMLRTETYEMWKDIVIDFDPKEAYRS